jgi:hypothetical protein
MTKSSTLGFHSPSTFVAAEKIPSPRGPVSKYPERCTRDIHDTCSKGETKPAKTPTEPNLPPTTVCFADEVVLPVPRTTLRVWNLFLFLFHTGLAVTTLVLSNRDLQVDVYRSRLEFVVRGGAGDLPREVGFDLVPVAEEAGVLYLTWLVAAFFLLSAFFHLLNATLLNAWYNYELERCRTPTRWIEYFFSASCMQVLLSYTLGIRDRSLIFTLAALVATTMPYGYWTEVIARPRSPDRWTESLAYRLFPWILGHVPQVSAWFVVIYEFYDANSENADRVPWFVYVILYAEAALFFSFGFVQLFAQCLPPRRFYQAEILFQVLSLVSKGTLGGILIFNVLFLSAFEEIFEDQE